MPYLRNPSFRCVCLGLLYRYASLLLFTGNGFVSQLAGVQRSLENAAMFDSENLKMQ
jgi:hypothetical protein